MSKTITPEEFFRNLTLTLSSWTVHDFLPHVKKWTPVLSKTMDDGGSMAVVYRRPRAKDVRPGDAFRIEVVRPTGEVSRFPIGQALLRELEGAQK